jgi:outer membrane protein OmpA-like peptidoglycan-associated protein/tetratricopeptide (TPR) repeat protein
MFFLFLFSFSLLSAGNGETENTKRNARKADNYFVFSNYMDALPLYEELVKEEPNNVEYNYRLGLCYFNSNKDVLKCIPYFEAARKNFTDESMDADLYLWLGFAYHTTNQFEKAIECYTSLKDMILPNKEVAQHIAELEEEIEKCKKGIVLRDKPSFVLVENMGIAINSEYPDYAPVISPDEKMIMFTSKRKGSTGGKLDEDKFFYEDVYVSKKNNSDWKNARLLDSVNTQNRSEASNKNKINTKSHDASITLSSDGKKLYIYRLNDIWVSDLQNANWSKPEKLNELIDAKKSHEPSVSLTMDNNTLYFVSERSGGYGGKDIYKSTKQSNGTWGEPVNLGDLINTPFDEDAPFIDTETNTLYFSSEGHENIGGFDVFKSSISDGKFSVPENLGFPINTGADDIFYVMNHSKEKAYLTSIRENGVGNYDIYELVFLDKVKVRTNYLVQNKTRFNNLTSSIVLKDLKSGTTDSLINSSGELAYRLNENYQLSLINTKGGNHLVDYTIPVIKSSKDCYFQKIKYEEVLDSLGHITGVRTLVSNVFVNIDSAIVSADDWIADKSSVKEYSFVDYFNESELLALNGNSIKSEGVHFKTILFDFEKNDLKSEFEGELDKVVAYMQTNKEQNIIVVGHTDSKGADVYNYFLSLKRAVEVKRYIVSKGISGKRLSAKGEGEKVPAIPNENADGSDNEEGRKQNRRVEFIFPNK